MWPALWPAQISKAVFAPRKQTGMPALLSKARGTDGHYGPVIVILVKLIVAFVPLLIVVSTLSDSKGPSVE